MSPSFWFYAGIISVVLIVLWDLRRRRRSAITGEKARKQHFQKLSKELNLRFVTDNYFLQLEGSRNGSRVILYPHNFEGPGFITLLYLEAMNPAQDRNWIEPNLSLGRAIVEWKRQASYNYETSGSALTGEKLFTILNTLKSSYPYVAVTLPWRFSYSPLLQNALSSWKNYVVFLAMDAGRYPAAGMIEQAISDASKIANALNQSTTFSDTTG